MMNLILMLALAPTAPAPRIARIQTCQWPHRCVEAPVARIQTCQWPHRCVETAQDATPFKA